MNKNRVIILSSVALVGLTACGKSYQGNYRGTETIVSTYGYGSTSTTQSGSQSQALTISLNDNGYDGVIGTFISASHSGNLQAQVTGSGLSNVVLTLNPTTSSTQNISYSTTTPYSSYSGYAGYAGYTQPLTTQSYGCTGTFAGNLTLTNNNRLTGSLTPMNTTTASNCGIASLSIDVQK